MFRRISSFPSPGVKVGAIRNSETSVTTCKVGRRHCAGSHIRCLHCRENLKYQKMSVGLTTMGCSVEQARGPSEILRMRTFKRAKRSYKNSLIFTLLCFNLLDALVLHTVFIVLQRHFKFYRNTQFDLIFLVYMGFCFRTSLTFF